MKFSTLFAFSALAIATTFAATSDPLRGIVAGTGSDAPKGYVPPLISNGQLSMLVDWTCGMQFRKYAGMIPAVYWAGRRELPSTSLLPFGKFKMDITIDGTYRLNPEQWEQELDVQHGKMRTRHIYQQGVALDSELFVPLNKNLVACQRTFRVTDGKTKKVTASLHYIISPNGKTFGAWKWDETKNRATYDFRWFGKTVNDTTIAIYTTPGTTLQAKEKIDGKPSTFGNGKYQAGNGSTMSLTETFTLAPEKPHTVTFYIQYVDQTTKNRAAAIDAQQTWLDKNGFAVLSREQDEAWGAYYGESEIRIPDPKIQRMIDVAQYHLRANATLWSFPVGIFPTHWHGRYFGWDEMFCHQGLIAANHVDIAQRCPNYRKAILPQAIQRARHYHTGPTYGARYLWESTEDGIAEGSPLGFWLDHIFHTSNIARSAWLQYLYSDDLEYLETTGYPVILECARYFRKNYVYEDSDGTCYIGKCTDLERLGPARDRPFMTTCGAIATLRAAADASDILKTNAAEAADFRKTADRLVQSLPSRNGAYIAYKDATVPSVATLGGLFPYPIFDKDNALQREAAFRFVRNGRAAGNMYPVGKGVCPWYAGKMAVAMTLLGDKQEPIKLLREAANVTGLFGETFEINEPGIVVMHPWFTTASGNCLYALCQMLLCDAEGKTFIGRGIPMEWKEFAFRLPAFGGILIDVACKEGKLTKLTLTPKHPERKHKINLVVPNRWMDETLRAKPNTQSAEDDSTSFTLVMDRAISLK